MIRLPPAFRREVAGESWKDLAKVVFAVWLPIWIMAAMHNQYLIRIAPEHFTVWHYKIPFTQDYTLLGISYAFGASLSPGIMLGLLVYLAARVFDRPKRTIRQIVISILWVGVLVEACAATAGLVVWWRQTGIYPDWVYPDDSLGLTITQSIQVTAYLSGLVISLGLVAWTGWVRGRMAERGELIFLEGRAG